MFRCKHRERPISPIFFRITSLALGAIIRLPQVSVKQPWKILANASRETIIADYITTTKDKHHKIVCKFYGLYCIHRLWRRLAAMIWAIIGADNVLIARFMGPTWGPSGANRAQVGPCWPDELCYLSMVYLLFDTKLRYSIKMSS